MAQLISSPVTSSAQLTKGRNTGIGKATAVDLARRGARVILTCRDRVRGESSVYNIRRESGNSEVILMILDLSNLNSVRADLLKIGAPSTTQVNHLDHFLLMHLLLDRLKRCAPSRVIIVASNMHSFGKIDFRTIYTPVEGMWQAIRSYSNSKLANIIHVRELAKRLEGTNVTCYAVHPVWLLQTIKSFLRGGKTDAQTSIYCATEEGIERLSGRYFVDCLLKVPWPQACDDQVAEKLWEFNELLLGRV